MSDEGTFDAVIIGAGPAGISAGIWCRDLGLTAVVLEREPEPGGQLLSIHNPITNYPGLRTENGRKMRDCFMETAASYGLDIRLSSEVVEVNTDRKLVITASGERFHARAIIVATGVRRRKLNIPGETELQGKGIIESGSRDKEQVRGKTVAIIGGGDAALENALILADYAAKIYLIHRRDRFSARDEFVGPVRSGPRIECLLKTAVTRIGGSESVEWVDVNRASGTDERRLSVDRVLIRVGVEPNDELIKGLDITDNGAHLPAVSAANAPFILMAGDVVNPVSMTIATAAGEGARASKIVRHLLSGKKSLLSQ